LCLEIYIEFCFLGLQTKRQYFYRQKMDRNRKRPLTIPTQVEHIEGVDWLTFVYTAKGISTDYRIRIDINTIDTTDLPADFKEINSVYPKAFVDRKEYKGNRWEYETTVNEIGWKLCYLNQDLLVSKRGLLQRAVDRYMILTTVIGMHSLIVKVDELPG
jgi:hypothetical protein